MIEAKLLMNTSLPVVLLVPSTSFWVSLAFRLSICGPLLFYISSYIAAFCINDLLRLSFFCLLFHYNFPHKQRQGPRKTR